MAIEPFLAMTAAEIRNLGVLSPRIAWMSCHFSSYGRGLSNLPDSLPPGSLLVVDDSTPVCGHDPEQIREQLTGCLQTMALSGILLDFQRQNVPEAEELVKYLIDCLPERVVVSEGYADKVVPVFLSPLPPSVPLRNYLRQWEGREIWLDLSPAPECLHLTEAGCTREWLQMGAYPEGTFADEALHCHYRISLEEKTADFMLWRTWEDLCALMEEAQFLGVRNAVGLYQEWEALGWPVPL